MKLQQRCGRISVINCPLRLKVSRTCLATASARPSSFITRKLRMSSVMCVMKKHWTIYIWYIYLCLFESYLRKGYLRKGIWTNYMKDVSWKSEYVCQKWEFRLETLLRYFFLLAFEKYDRQWNPLLPQNPPMKPAATDPGRAHRIDSGQCHKNSQWRIHPSWWYLYVFFQIWGFSMLFRCYLKHLQEGISCFGGKCTTSWSPFWEPKKTPVQLPANPSQFRSAFWLITKNHQKRWPECPMFFVKNPTPTPPSNNPSVKEKALKKTLIWQG